MTVDESVANGKGVEEGMELVSLEKGANNVEQGVGDNEGPTTKLIYGVEDVPPPLLTFLIALQQAAMSMSGSIAVPMLVSELVCLTRGSADTAFLVSTFLLMCGVSTLLQCTFGVRLPIIQGGCSKFIPAIAALMSLDRFRCTPQLETLLSGNSTNSSLSAPEEQIHLVRLREIQGGIILSSLAELVLAASGVIGIFLNFIGPLTIMPTITLVGLSLAGLAARLCQVNWGIAFLTIALILLFSLYLSNICVPMPTYTRREGLHITWSPIFKLLPVVLAAALSWTLCHILTVTGVFTSDPEENGYLARSDGNLIVLQKMPWFYIPYPGQWGMPTFGLATFLGMLAATLASIIESIGDYYACARACDLPPPPAHAMNRGIALEGLGGILAGVFGSGGATTSYSQNVGAIGFTRAGSRRAFQVAGLIFIACGVFGKFGAFVTMMPTPILGAILVVGLGMVSAVGISNLQYVDMKSPRNQCIIGMSLMLGLVIPTWSARHPDAIGTGLTELDQSIKVLMQTSMFVGGIIAFVLDNTVPGTRKERGLLSWKQVSTESAPDACVVHCETYDLPFITPWLNRQRWARFVPILPPLNEHLCRTCCCRPCKRT